MRIRWISLVAACALAAPVAVAQPRDHRDDKQARRMPPPRDDGPKEAPPPPKAEAAPGQKAGYVWVTGRWNWKGDKYEWVPGHWERTRANKKWREGRWEKRGDRWAYVDGAWVDKNEPPPAPTPTPTPPPIANDRPRDAPPPPREEKRDAARAGYVWVAGEWDWKNGNYEWVPGHWERARANKEWRPSRWEQREGRWQRTPGEWIDRGNTPPPPIANDGPREAPPTPREERREAARAGYVWVAGEWDWKNGAYEWVPGHWERERANKEWRPSRWEQREGRWLRTPGDWIDRGNTPPPIANPSERPRPPRRDWKFERPVVSNFWPTKGKVGSKIVIRGKNFPKDAIVMWAGKEIRGVKVTDGEVRFIVPNDATSGVIAVRAGRQDLLVGNFEVAANFDAEAERKRLEDEARKRAETEWAARQKQLAKDRAAREDAVRKRWQERMENREQRRAERLAQIRARYAAAFLANAETQDEMNLHAQRIAELERMADVAEIKADTKLAIRVDMLRQREDRRHEERMTALDAAFRAGGAR
jgi:hypothetical protein